MAKLGKDQPLVFAKIIKSYKKHWRHHTEGGKLQGSWRSSRRLTTISLSIFSFLFFLYFPWPFDITKSLVYIWLKCKKDNCLKNFKGGHWRKLKKGLRLQQLEATQGSASTWRNEEEDQLPLSLYPSFISIWLSGIFTSEQEGPIAFNHPTLDQQVRNPWRFIKTKRSTTPRKNTT